MVVVSVMWSARNISSRSRDTGKTPCFAANHSLASPNPREPTAPVPVAFALPVPTCSLTDSCRWKDTICQLLPRSPTSSLFSAKYEGESSYSMIFPSKLHVHVQTHYRRGACMYVCMYVYNTRYLHTSVLVFSPVPLPNGSTNDNKRRAVIGDTQISRSVSGEKNLSNPMRR